LTGAGPRDILGGAASSGGTTIQCLKCGADLNDYSEEELSSGLCPECGTQVLGAGLEGEISELEAEAATLARQTIHDLLGKTVGSCEIREVLGTGGMGVVFKAHHLALDKIVAVKTLPGSLASTGGGHIERFLTEARAAARIEHPNIVQVFDISEDAGYYYIIMQYVDGPDLHKLINERGPLDAELALTIVQQIALALHEIHKAGVIHRDIKPTNILITRSGQVKITDLGLAKLRRRRGGASDSNVSDPNVVLGTPDYMAPEQAVKGGGGDERSDIYSLGATFYHLLTGRPPFLGETSVAILVKHASEPLVSPRMINPKVPTQVARIVEKMMEKDPARRYQTASELMHALQKAEGELARGPSGIAPYNFRRSALRQNAYLTATALQRGQITGNKVLEALAVQRELVAFGSPRSISEIFVEKGYMASAALDALVDDYEKRERERVNTLFGRIAVAEALVDRDALDDSLAEQTELLRAGQEVLIGKLLMDRGAMTSEQVRAVLRRQGEIQRSADESFFESEALRNGVPPEHIEDCLAALAEMDPEEDQTLVGMLLDAGHIDAETAHEMVAAQIRQLIESLAADADGRVVVETPPPEPSAASSVSKLRPMESRLTVEKVPGVDLGAAPQFEDVGLEALAECPKCRAEISPKAIVCPECGADIGPPALADWNSDGPAPVRAAPVGGDGGEPPAPEDDEGLSVAEAVEKEDGEAPAAERAGDWGFLSGDPGTGDGLTHEEMVRHVREGAIDEDTTVRGPSTGGSWVFAGRAPGIAKYLGICPHCQRPVGADDQICVHCDRFLDVPEVSSSALPQAGEGSIAKLRRWLKR